MERSMSRFDELRRRYVAWNGATSAWLSLMRQVPFDFKNGLAAYLEAPSEFVAPFNKDPGPYVDLYLRTQDGRYQRAEPFDAAYQKPDGEWFFAVGIWLDPDATSFAKTRMVIECRVRKNGDNLVLRPTGIEQDFPVGLDQPHPFEAVYEAVFHGLMEYLGTPYPDTTKKPIGFDIVMPAAGAQTGHAGSMR
jgi:hypothetical protein